MPVRVRGATAQQGCGASSLVGTQMGVLRGSTPSVDVPRGHDLVVDWTVLG